MCEKNKVDSYVNRVEKNFLKYLKKIINPKNKVTIENSKKFKEALLEENEKNINILIIGSGTIGDGTNIFYQEKRFNVYGTDIYLSDSVDIVADAHYLPYKNETFDGVWIQAVLEHVVEPYVVVANIEKLLRPNGFVYAETPFMQQVHEGAHDFTRFTLLGHRYLFKNFNALDIGMTKGAGESLYWAIKYFFLALFRNTFVANVLALPFKLLLNSFEFILDKRSAFDSSSGVYFFGKKSDKEISHKDLIKLYKGMN